MPRTEAGSGIAADEWVDPAVCYSQLMASRNGLPKVRVLNRQQGLELLDRRAQAELGMSGAEFVRLWRKGKLRRRADRPEIIRVAMLLPFAR